MREAFNQVRGAVSRKDLVPVLTHFAIHGGRVHGYNGRIHIATRCPEAEALPDFTVPAALATSAVDACKGEPCFDVNLEEGRCVITDDQSSFRATLPAGKIEEFPIPPLPAKAKRLRQPLLPLLRALQSFIGDDASRPWASSILFNQEGRCAMATNNIALAAIDLPEGFPDIQCALPVFAVDELLRLGQEPIGIVPDGEHALFFLLPDKTWIRTALVAEQWPDALAILEEAHKGATFKAVPPDLREAVERIAPLCPDTKRPVIVFSDTRVETQAGSSCASIDGFKGLQGTYHAEPLRAVLNVALTADWGRFPRVPWKGLDSLLGVFVGIIAP